MRMAGIVHTARSRSNSTHRAPSTSPDRAAEIGQLTVERDSVAIKDQLIRKA